MSSKCKRSVRSVIIAYGPSFTIDGPYVSVKQVTHTKENTGNLMCVLHVLKAKRELIMYDYASFFKRHNERDTPSENNTGICLSIARSMSIAQTDEEYDYASLSKR